MEDVVYCENCGAEIDPGYDCPCGIDYEETEGDIFQEKYDIYANEY